MSKKVHIGFGFHVNCYHSYRGDTPDAMGFGGDIRIMRKIINILDDFNKAGVPVKGTWDFENAFSLEEVLPKYAPDIIENVKRRCEENGDENILMGYNNGAMSAMTEDEFLASVELAVTNDKKSGLVDVFGDCEMVIRPQEVMFSPSQVPLYRKAGIKGVCLYYSCVPFDAFRTIIPQLKEEYAFNPLDYVYQGEHLTILPTYTHSDIIDAGSLRYLVSDLHQKQVKGEIQEDVFLFINIDADSFLWEPMPVPNFMKNIPNISGLLGLIEETKDLEFVVYDTPSQYLKTHKPVTEITFSHDTADGNFTGYASWSEKPFNRQIWTRLERARSMARLSEADKLSPSFSDRIRLLSTTHFGLASPVMNITREEKALELSNDMVKKEYEQCKSETGLKLVYPEETRVASGQLLLKEGFCDEIYKLQAQEKDLMSFGAVPLDFYENGSVKSIFWMGVYKGKRKECSPEFSVLKEVVSKEHISKAESILQKELILEADATKLVFGEKGLKEIFIGERKIGGKDFLKSSLVYQGKEIQFSQKQVTKIKGAGEMEGVCLQGEIHLPEELEAGHYCYTFVTLPNTKGIYLITKVQYPYTLEDHEISTSSSSLGRYSDNNWEQVLPFEMTPDFDQNIRVIKRNFMNHTNQYLVDDFWESVAENEELDSFNHQLSGGLVGLGDDTHTLLLANVRQVLNSMAHCPMRLRKTATGHRVSMNAFGTYYGKQRTYPTRGNGSMNEMYVLTMPQARSLAPSYNGALEQSVMALYSLEQGCEKFLPMDEAKGELFEELLAFSDGGVVINSSDSVAGAYLEDNVTLKDAKRKQTPKKLKGAAAAGVGSRSRLVVAGIKTVQQIIKASHKAKRISQNLKNSV